MLKPIGNRVIIEKKEQEQTTRFPTRSVATRRNRRQQTGDFCGDLRDG